MTAPRGHECDCASCREIVAAQIVAGLRLLATIPPHARADVVVTALSRIDFEVEGELRAALVEAAK